MQFASLERLKNLLERHYNGGGCLVETGGGCDGVCDEILYLHIMGAPTDVRSSSTTAYLAHQQRQGSHL